MKNDQLLHSMYEKIGEGLFDSIRWNDFEKLKVEIISEFISDAIKKLSKHQEIILNDNEFMNFIENCHNFIEDVDAACYEYYYAECELYVYHKYESRILKFVKATSVRNAFEKIIEEEVGRRAKEIWEWIKS